MMSYIVVVSEIKIRANKTYFLFIWAIASLIKYRSSVFLI